MTFFNRKEDVLDIQITQFGKHLLSKGVFKPTYYAFFDDDVLYDGAFGGLTEHQNEIETRIKETPRLRTQHVYHGLETEIKKSIDLQRLGAQQDDSIDRNAPDIVLEQPSSEKHFSNAQPLGNSGLGIQAAASLSIKYLKGEMTDSNNILSNSNTPNVSIPQLNSDIVYETRVVKDEYSYGPYDDGTNIDTTENFIVLELEELNSFRLNKNFEIEIFEVEKEIIAGIPTGREVLRPLTFPSDNPGFTITEDNVYKIDDNSAVPLSDYADLNSSMVEYFFNIELDTQIDANLMCELKPVEKTKGLFSKKLYDCQDQDNLEEGDRDIYGFENEYEDPCD